MASDTSERSIATAFIALGTVVVVVFYAYTLSQRGYSEGFAASSVPQANVSGMPAFWNTDLSRENERREAIRAAFVEVLRRFPTPPETDTFLRVLQDVPGNDASGGTEDSDDSPTQRVAEVLRELQGPDGRTLSPLVASGARDAATTGAPRVRTFSGAYDLDGSTDVPRVYVYGDPREQRLHLLVRGVFARVLGRAPTCDETERFVAYGRTLIARERDDYRALIRAFASALYATSEYARLRQAYAAHDGGAAAPYPASSSMSNTADAEVDAWPRGCSRQERADLARKYEDAWGTPAPVHYAALQCTAQIPLHRPTEVAPELEPEPEPELADHVYEYREEQDASGTVEADVRKRVCDERDNETAAAYNAVAYDPAAVAGLSSRRIEGGDAQESTDAESTNAAVAESVKAGQKFVNQTTKRRCAPFDAYGEHMLVRIRQSPGSPATGA